jgi:hypothetical protein
MKTLSIKNWDTWQTYRKDRGAPPWIKVHRCLLTHIKWASLSDAEKGHILSIWIVGADRGGEIPNCPKTIRKICQLDTEPNLRKFIELGFLVSNGSQDDATMTPQERQDDAPEKRREEKRREEYMSALDAYQAVAKRCGLTRVQKMSEQRKAKLQARLKDCGGLDGWNSALSKIEQSDFCKGINKEGWKADFDFLLQESSFIKLIEGKYDNRQINNKPKQKPLPQVAMLNLQ